MNRTVLFCSDDLWAERGDELRAVDPDVEVVLLTGDERVSVDDLERITVAFFSGDTWPDRASALLGTCLRAPNLTWLHTFSAGTDAPIFATLQQRGVVVTNSSGSSAPSIAQSVLLDLLALSRDLPRLIRAQSGRRWEPETSIDLHGLRLGIVGLGAIGSEVARLAQAFGMDVVGLRRSVTGDEICETWTDDRFGELLARSDAVVVTAPLNDQTRGMFDAAAFAAMTPGAWFVNVGRGEIVDETALVDALTSGRLGGAGLDVFAVEPLPTESPLWDLPNVIVTPHSSGTTERSQRRSVDQFVANFRRFRTGEALQNIAR